jgi:hypothetical protein
MLLCYHVLPHVCCECLACALWHPSGFMQRQPVSPPDLLRMLCALWHLAGGAEAVAADRPLGHDERHHLQCPEGTPAALPLCNNAHGSGAATARMMLLSVPAAEPCRGCQGIKQCALIAGWPHQRCGCVRGLLQPLQHWSFHGEGQELPAVLVYPLEPAALTRHSTDLTPVHCH